MTSKDYMTIAFIAFSSGIGVFLGALGGDKPPMLAHKLVLAFLFVIGAMLGVFFLALYNHMICACILAAYAACFMTAICRDALEPHVSGRVKISIWLVAIILMATTTYFAYDTAERIVIEEEIIKNRESQVAREIEELRNPWYAELANGVLELTFDRLKVWLAAETPVEIDAEYERELGEGAQREIPIRIIFLNDSFMPVTSTSEKGLTPMNWSIKVLGVDSEVLRDWDIKEAEPRALQPAERRDYRVTWDGRDGKGNLLPAGDYSILIEVTTADGQTAKSLPFSIIDSGPIEIVEEDATTQYARHQESMSRSLQTIQEGIRMLDQMRFQRFPR